MSVQVKSTKRLLTSEEIEDIVMSLEPVKSIPLIVSESHISVARNRTREMLKNVSVYPEIIPQLKRKICEDYLSSRIQPGESVGIVTAQSIGERQTQMTLDTFHSAGAALKTVLTGVPRFSELLSATSNPKSVISTIYTNEKYNTVSELRNILGHSLKNILLSDVLTDIKYDKDIEIPDWYWGFEMINGNKYSEYPEFITLIFDIQKLFENKLELDTISSRIEKSYTDLRCVYSPTFLGRIDVYFDCDNIVHDDYENPIILYVEKVLIPNIEKLQVSGITEISEVFYDTKDGELFIETSGSNLKKIFNNPIIDSTRTQCNNMWEIHEVLGIEATRDFLIQEFHNIISSDGTNVNKCHIELLVDVMTFNGTISSISRYGQRKSNCGPLAKASFEESLENFLKASVYGEIEKTSSISSSIMLGKIPNCGTGIFDIFMDMSKIIDTDTLEETYDNNTVYEL